MTADPMDTLGSYLDPDTEEQESAFREEVRNILDLSHLSRNDTIYAELRRLKSQDRKLQVLSDKMAAELRMTEGK